MLSNRLSKIQKYGALNSHDMLKFIAIILMVIDHVGVYFFPDDLLFRAVGRACVPIWFFFIGRYESSRFTCGILAYAIAIEVVNFFVGVPGNLDILFTIIIVRLALQTDFIKTLHQQAFIAPIILCLIFYPITVPIVSYGSLGLMFAYAGYLQRIGSGSKKLGFYLAVAALAFVAIQSVLFQLSPDYILITSVLTMASAILLHAYKLRPINMPFGNVIMFLSRYSLEIYAVHLMAFMLINPNAATLEEVVSKLGW